jgi:hypothetical protein
VRSGNIGACCLLQLPSVGFLGRNWFTSNVMVRTHNFNLIYVVLLTSTPPSLSPLPVPYLPPPPPPLRSNQPLSCTNTFKAYVIQIKLRNKNCWYIKYSVFIDLFFLWHRLVPENGTAHVLEECCIERVAKVIRLVGLGCPLRLAHFLSCFQRTYIECSSNTFEVQCLLCVTLALTLKNCLLSTKLIYLQKSTLR